MKLFIQVFFMLFIFGCSGNKSEENNIPTSDSDSSLMPKKSQFQYWNKKIFKMNYEKEKNDTKIHDPHPDTLTMKQRKKWDYDAGYGLKLSSLFYGANFYSIQNTIGYIQPIIIEGSSDDYAAYVLLCLNKNTEMTSWLNIAGGIAAGPDSESVDTLHPAMYGHENYSKFSNDSIFFTYMVKTVDIIPTKTQKKQSFTFDSIVSAYQILRNGKIALLKKDSIRIRNPF